MYRAALVAVSSLMTLVRRSEVCTCFVLEGTGTTHKQEDSDREEKALQGSSKFCKTQIFCSSNSLAVENTQHNRIGLLGFPFPQKRQHKTLRKVQSTQSSTKNWSRCAAEDLTCRC